MTRLEQGQGAEGLASAWLEANGYSVKARNYRCRMGEVDVVAEQNGVLCFVEVRSRTNSAGVDPLDTVTRQKQQKVVRTAMHFLQTQDCGDVGVRFDVMSVVGSGAAMQVAHVPNAFDAGF